jgi:hypothetical protein
MKSSKLGSRSVFVVFSINNEENILKTKTDNIKSPQFPIQGVNFWTENTFWIYAHVRVETMYCLSRRNWGQPNYVQDSYI